MTAATRKLAGPPVAAIRAYDHPMTTWFVSRHPGATEWARRQGLHVDEYLTHLDPARIRAGDTVIGSLPVNLAARVCAAGARYLHISLELPANLRGRELSAEVLTAVGATLRAYNITLLPGGWSDGVNSANST